MDSFGWVNSTRYYVLKPQTTASDHFSASRRPGSVGAAADYVQLRR
jgi:hypothetical protein